MHTMPFNSDQPSLQAGDLDPLHSYLSLTPSPWWDQWDAVIFCDLCINHGFPRGLHSRRVDHRSTLVGVWPMHYLSDDQWTHG